MSTTGTNTGTLKPYPSRVPVIPTANQKAPRRPRRRATIADLAKFFNISRRSMVRIIDRYPGRVDFYDIQSILRFTVGTVKQSELYGSVLRKGPKGA